MSDDDLDRPEESASADVTLITKGVTVTACVEVSSTGDGVVVRPTSGGPGWQESPVQTGDAVELYWVGGEEERTLGGKISRVDGGSGAALACRGQGPGPAQSATQGGPGTDRAGGAHPVGGSFKSRTTVDLSETGMRALMDGWGVPPCPRDAQSGEPDPGGRPGAPARGVHLDIHPRGSVAPGHAVRRRARQGRRRPAAAGLPGTSGGASRRAGLIRRRRSGSPGSVRAPGSTSVSLTRRRRGPRPAAPRDPVDPPPGAPT